MPNTKKPPEPQDVAVAAAQALRLFQQQDRRNDVRWESQMMSVDTLAIEHGMSKGFLEQLINSGEGPDIVQFPGTSRIFITREDADAWRASLPRRRRNVTE